LFQFGKFRKLSDEPGAEVALYIVERPFHIVLVEGKPVAVSRGIVEASAARL